ncbi:MAG: hypothetical protein WCP12_17500 [bacterium]
MNRYIDRRPWRFVSTLSASMCGAAALALWAHGVDVAATADADPVADRARVWAERNSPAAVEAAAKGLFDLRIGRISCIFEGQRDTAKSDKGASVKSLEG